MDTVKKIKLTELKYKSKTLHIFGETEKMTTDNWKEYPVTVDAYWGTDDQGRMWSKFKKEDGKSKTDELILNAVCIVCDKAIADKQEWVCLDSAEQACEECMTIEKTAGDQVAYNLLKEAGFINNNDHSKCPKCGYEKLKSWFRFCVECGHKLKE